MRTIVGYEEAEGRVRRLVHSGEAYGGPIDRDLHGLADARGSGPRLSLGPSSPAPAAARPPTHLQPAIGAGPIERRHLAPDELAARRAAEERPSPIAPRPAVIRGPVPMPPPTSADVARLEVELPCDHCTHRKVCRIRAAFIAIQPEFLLPVLPDGLAGALHPRLDCDFFVLDEASIDGAPEAALEGVTTAPASPVPSEPAAAAGRPGSGRPAPRSSADVRRRREEEIIRVLRETGSSTAAAGPLGITPSRVRQLIAKLRRDKRLPADLEARLASRKGGRRPKAAA